MGDDFTENLPAIAAGAAAAVLIGASAVNPFFAVAAPTLLGLIGGAYAAGSVAKSFLMGPPIPEFSPSGIGGSAGPRGTPTGGKSFSSTGDGGFRRTDTSPQSPVPMVVGTYMIAGTLLDFFPLGENDKRSFSVVGIAKPPLSIENVQVDDIDINTLPNYIDVDSGGVPEDNKPWLKSIGNGGEAGDVILNNSGKKNYNINIEPGEVGVTPNIYFFNVASGRSEVRIFMSVETPGILEDWVQSVDADYSSLNGKTLILDFVRVNQSVVTQETVTFTAGATDAASAAGEINGQTTDMTATVVNVDEIRIENTNNPTNKRIELAGTAFSQLGFNEQNFGSVMSYELKIQEKDSATPVTVYTDTNLNVSSISNSLPQSNSLLISLKRLETSAAAYGALNGKSLDVDVAGTTRTTTFTASAVDAATAVDEINTQIGTWVTASVINTTEIRINTTTGGLAVSGAAQSDLGFSLVDGDFFFDVSIPNSGFWSFILDVSKATNGARINIAIAEVMNDFTETEDGDFSGIGGQTLIIEINDGTLQTITFGGGTNTAALAIIDINNQLGLSVLASPSDSEILIEAIGSPEGTETVSAVKKLKVAGGTAATAMNFKSIYSETKNYDFGVGYALINLVKDNRISGNPRFTFEVTGGSNNPAQNLLHIFEGGGVFGKGMNIPKEIDRESFLNSIDFDTTENLQCNMAMLDSSYGESIQAFIDAGSLILFENGGRYKLIPETDSQVAAELYVTDDLKKDGIIRDSWSWSVIDETQKFNVLRVTYPDADKDYISRDIVIDITGEVDTENGEVPRMYEGGSLIDISDSGFDFLRARTRNFPAVTSRTQALRLGTQIFKKQNLGNIALSLGVSIRHAYLEKGDIVSIFIDELGFVGKPFRLLGVQESGNFGYSLALSEHFSEMYK